MRLPVCRRNGYVDMPKDLEPGEHDQGSISLGPDALRGIQTVPAPVGVAQNQQLKPMKPCIPSVTSLLRICKILHT